MQIHLIEDHRGINKLYNMITQILKDKGLTITTMESCTSGLVASLLTNIEGSSKVLKGAFVTYCNEAKIQQGVPRETIEEYGVYSPQTAIDMAEACQIAYGADIGIGVTGTASNVDSHNSDSISNVVFFAITTDTQRYMFRFDTPECKERLYWKFIVAKQIGEQLLRILKKEN